MSESKNEVSEKEYDPESELVSMSLGDHLEELRHRLMLALVGLVLGVAVSLFFGEYFFKMIMFPYHQAMEKAGYKPNLLALKPMEQFIIYLKICMVAGLVFSSLWVFYQAWAFVSAGLYRHERRWVKVAAPVSGLLFVTGAVFFMLAVAPMMMNFCVKFNVGVEYVQPGVYALAEYVNFMLLLTLIFGLAFQMPIAIVFAEMIGIVTIRQLSEFRKFAILGIVIVAAAITPSPDVISQIALAVPLYMLYEGSIIVCRILRAQKKKTKEKSNPQS